MKEKDLKILLYADVDLNVIDGSSIWVTSLMSVLTQCPKVELTLLLKRPIIRPILLEPFLINQQIHLIDPWKAFDKNPSHKKWFLEKKLAAEDAVSLIEILDSRSCFDVIIVRGFDISVKIADNKNLASKTWTYIIPHFSKHENQEQEKQNESLKGVFEKVKYILCQTEALMLEYQNHFGLDKSKLIILPPMVPNYPLAQPTFKKRYNNLVYVGKFSKQWNTHGMIDAFNKLRNKDPNVIFHVAGDKFNKDKDDNKFQTKICHKLKNTPGLVWHKGISRQEVEALIEKCDVGISWKSSELDNSLELSTKILEYGRLGKPVIVNRTPINENLLGKDYPLYANSEEEFIGQIRKVLLSSRIYEEASKRLYEVCKQFTYSEVYNKLYGYLWGIKKEIPIVQKQKIKLLFAGHDMKFAKLLVDYFKSSKDYEVQIDKWKNTFQHNPSDSLMYLEWADVIICEWAVGNAVWYSKHKRSDQVLLVRMHRFEITTPYPKQFNLENIDKIVTIAPHTTSDFIEKFNIPPHKFIMINSLIDTKKFDLEKIENPQYNLGILGYCPSLKRLDRALDLFENLWSKDQRYRLYVKGKSPQEIPWIWENINERRYYDAIFERVNSSQWRESVVFEDWTDNVHDWFRKIGFILSVSDLEGSHVAVSEGMASGSIPILLNWRGADKIYPSQFIFPSTEDAAQYISRLAENDQNIDSLRMSVKMLIQKDCDKDLIAAKWKELIEENLRLKNKRLSVKNSVIHYLLRSTHLIK
ncbi:Glycosyltransferase involved in cell wall bisynthesis [Geosporobacter subterraneus DSM 17957]|uniref:Glycosyltransferase involved in cell wall bisynthesis n=1 Tax=Geosporobacter subterraneus DSM 17957 TaxID=1121919 RepID=A0A1M6PKA4_9FIRM|nr:glycosyltransferase [Geosporobacter subterraneus]SHK08389.1 Glycosyltransferase involved in cell wall bisynthesis [Geosporobacter subterraneus DSM 17957]